VKRWNGSRSGTEHATPLARLSSQRVEELPDDLEAGVLYLVGEGSHLWFVGMRCPCGCGDNLTVSLVEDSGSFWSISIHRDRTVSIYPSVRRTLGCGSHFNIKRGRVIWVRGLK
jgi:hypothetical protein